MQEATLPQRLARSAKNLASATLTGSNFELRDPRESKQAGSSSTQTSLGSKEYCSGNAHSKIISSHRQDEFRSRPDSMIRRQTEEEFDHFQATDDFQKWQNQGVSAYYEPICGADVLRGESSIIADENQTINAVKTIAVVTDHVTDMLDFSETPKSTSVVEVKSARDVNVSYSHAAAIQRLNQIGAHLQRNVAMQALEQNTLAQSHKAMHGMTFDVQVEHAHEISDELRDPGQSDEQHKSRYVDERHSSSSHLAARNKASAGPVRKGKEKEQEEPQRRFHCPYYACHQNMQMLATSISNSSQRSCVHVGCDFYGETSNLWNEHVHTPHHDLQG